MPDLTRYALAAIYTVLTEAMALATGKPAEQLANHLLREMLDDDTPPEAADLLSVLARDYRDQQELPWLDS